MAAASGSTDNDYSVVTEYYGMQGGTKSYLAYKIHAGTPQADGDVYPTSGCTAEKGYAACITDSQLRTEVKRYLAAHGLPHTLADLYPVFFPPNVETAMDNGENSVANYCGYHGSFGAGTTATIYVNMPYEPTGCDAGQAPNGNVVADGTVSTLTHEVNEAMTDPTNAVAWVDKAGNEIGDECAQTFGQRLGSTNPSNKSGTEYNAVINGGKYYIQQLFSNFSYSRNGLGEGCTLSEALAQHPSASGNGAGATTVASVFSDATPTTLPANGTATSTIVAIVGDQHNLAVQGDHVHFDLGVESDSWTCGTLSKSDATTDANGYATVTYSASTSNVTCWVLAVDAEGGLAGQSALYQGTTQHDSPTLTSGFVTSLKAGQQSTFSMKEGNPGPTAVPDVNIDLQISPASSSSAAVKASQVQLSYSTDGSNGTFTSLPLSGTTSDGNVITGIVGPAAGAALAAGSTTPLTFHVTVDRGVPLSSTTPLIAFEGHLDQVNSASGSGASLADTYATNVTVATAAPASSGLAWWAIVLIALGALIVIGVGLLLLSRRRHPEVPRGPIAPA